ncbi:MAG: hypothetical protein Q7T80_04995 [Methanoregula sp.]|nr:hypothetical protein [Methanoregula sp.]
MILDRFTGRAKVVIVLCCLLLVVATVLFAIGFSEQVQVRKQLVQDRLKIAAGHVAGQVNGDGLLTLKPGDEGTPLYLSFANTLHNARRNNPYVVAAYIMRVDNGTISYVIDDTYLSHGMDPSVAKIGDLISEDKAVINASLSGPESSPDIYTSKWGSFSSGYAPVRDSNGIVVGILGIDVTSDTVLQYEYSTLFHLVEVV